MMLKFKTLLKKLQDKKVHDVPYVVKSTQLNNNDGENKIIVDKKQQFAKKHTIDNVDQILPINQNNEIIYDNYSDATKYGIETINKFIHLIEDLKQQKWYIESFSTMPKFINQFEQLLNTEYPNLTQLVNCKYDCDKTFLTILSHQDKINEMYYDANNQVINNMNIIKNNNNTINELKSEIDNVSNKITAKIAAINKEKTIKIQKISQEIQDKIQKLESDRTNMIDELNKNIANTIKQLFICIENRKKILNRKIDEILINTNIITKINMVFNNFIDCSNGKKFKQHINYISQLNSLICKAVNVIEYNSKILNEYNKYKSNKISNEGIINSNMKYTENESNRATLDNNNVKLDYLDNSEKNNDIDIIRCNIQNNNINDTIESNNEFSCDALNKNIQSYDDKLLKNNIEYINNNENMDTKSNSNILSSKDHLLDKNTNITTANNDIKQTNINNVINIDHK